MLKNDQLHFKNLKYSNVGHFSALYMKGLLVWLSEGQKFNTLHIVSRKCNTEAYSEPC